MHGAVRHLPRLQRRARDVIAVAYAVLERIGQRHPLARSIEEFARQQRVRLRPVGEPETALPDELLLRRLEDLPVDDRGMLARPGPPLVVDLADVMAIAQDVRNRAVGEGDAAESATFGENPLAGADSAGCEFAPDRANGAVR